MTAVKAAGLVDHQGAGPFTAFAPTDEAFANVPRETLVALLADKNKHTAVLNYHVVPGLVMSMDVSAEKLKTVQGSELTITSDGGVQVDDANVVGQIL